MFERDARELGAEYCHLGQEDFFDAGHTHVSQLLGVNVAPAIGLTMELELPSGQTLPVRGKNRAAATLSRAGTMVWFKTMVMARLCRGHNDFRDPSPNMVH